MGDNGILLESARQKAREAFSAPMLEAYKFLKPHFENYLRYVRLQATIADIEQTIRQLRDL